MLRTLLSILFTIGVFYTALALFLYFTQSGMLYYPNLPSREIVTTPDRYGMEYQTLQLQTSDNITLHGWYIPASNPRATLLFCHGNAGNISHRIESIAIFHQLGLNVLIFDYRGYGQSEGKPSERGTYRDAEAAWDYLTEQQNIPPHQIILFGRSLGGAIASHLASRKQPLGLIVESAFTSVPDMAAHYYPYLPVRWISRFRYNTRKHLGALQRPLLVIHSPEDEIIPYSNGQQLFDAAREPKQLLSIRGGHNDGFLLSGESYTRGLEGFINGLLIDR
jgi:fermentation-respiration switch protein FrsA (DUF1100 family)